MHVEPCDGHRYVAELTDDERMALAWAVEAGRALLLGDPDVRLLTCGAAVSTDDLDLLADELVRAGLPARPAPRTRRPASGVPRRRRMPHTR